MTRLDQQLRAVHGRGLTAHDLPAFLAGAMSTVAHATWRQYKAALLAYARHQAPADVLWNSIADHIATIRWVAEESASNLPARTSASKSKSPAADDIEALRKRLLLQDSIAARFLTAGLLCGLRPVEWATARFMSADRIWKLVVINAKHSNHRANGSYRTLWFTELSFYEIMAIRQTIESFHTASRDGKLEAFQEQIERAFHEANGAIWPRRRKRITPYSLRHAFSARAKAEYSSTEVAALMGHAVDMTAYTHYGRVPRRASSGPWPSLPKPDPQEVKNVRKLREASLRKLAANKIQPPIESEPGVEIVQTHNTKTVRV